jgi:superfamily I DNA/RNA helicase
MEITKIYGPPGTGKTTTLISIVEKLYQNGTPISDIAYLTHTRAGAHEVRKRIGEQFSDLTPEDLLWFRTIHSACCQMAGVTGRDTISTRQREMFYERYGYKLDEYDPRTDYGQNWNKCLEVISIATSEMRDIEEVRAEKKIPARSFYLFADTWKSFKNDIGMLDFNDQLESYDGDPAPVKYMIVDEAQDLSKKQWEIIRGLAGDCDHLYVAGDDDQSIYSFLGADEYGFLDLKADNEITLTKSYRVPKQIGQFAEKIIERNIHRKPKDVEWADHDGQIKKIGKLSQINFDNLEDTMILCRHNKQCKQVSSYLRKKDIHHSVNGDTLTSDKRAHIAKHYMMLSVGEGVHPLAAAQIAVHVGLNEEAKELRRLHKLGHHEVYDIPNLDLDSPNWISVLSKSRRDMQYFSELRGLLVKEGLDIIGREPQIKIMTYHYSKGREAETVICMTDVYETVWNELRNKSEVENRLAYVGATRAKKNLLIVRPETRQRFLPLI